MTPARPRRWVHAASLYVWIAYLIVPAEGWGFFHGRPLGLLSIAALAAASWVAFTRGTSPWRLVAITLVLKAGIGTTAIVPRGFAARYYANANFAGPAERSIEPADAAFTRTDSRLRFGVDNEPDVPLEFLNDLRYNFYRETEPDRNALPFSVTWEGFWRVTSAEPQRIYVVFSARVEANPRWTGVVTLSPGFHRVAITWAVPQGGARQFDAGQIVNQHDEPFVACGLAAGAVHAHRAVEREPPWNHPGATSPLSRS